MPIKLPSLFSGRRESPSKIHLDAGDKYDPFALDHPFDNPYEIKDPATGKPLRLLFSRMPQILKACARPKSQPDPEDEPDREGTLDLAVVLSGNLLDNGRATDAQFLPNLTLSTRRMCDRLRYGFRIKSRVSWQWDVPGLMSEDSLELDAPQTREALANWYPDIDPHQCLDEMHQAQAELLAEAREILPNYNLILVGSPCVNQVMANVCDLALRNPALGGQLGMTLYPPLGNAPLKLRRARRDAATDLLKWEEYEADGQRHKNVGWVQMMKNPWSRPEKPRFLIHYGGFFPQGVLAAMRKRVRISTQLVAGIESGLPEADVIRRHLMQTQGNDALDFRFTGREDDFDERNFIPAHIVEAVVRPPRLWFKNMLRRSQWGGGPCLAYEGNVKAIRTLGGGES
jgi:hypothetical protein